MSTFRGINTIADLKRLCPGADIADDATVDAPEEKPTLATPSVSIINGVLVAVVPVKTASETNQRQWKARSQRTKEARLAVSRTLGPHLGLLAYYAVAYHWHKGLRVTFTRLGGKRMDKSNLAAACKATEDALALMLGADDGSPSWHPSWEQDTAYPGVGVRIEISVIH